MYIAVGDLGIVKEGGGEKLNKGGFGAPPLENCFELCAALLVFYYPFYPS